MTRGAKTRRPASAGWKALGALAFVEAAAFGFFGRGIGFYHDDWVLLDEMHALHGFWPRVKALSWLATRPLDMLLYPALYGAAGMSGPGQHLLRMAAELLSAFLFYRLLARLTRLPRYSLAAAALALIVPNHEVIHFWFGIANESWAIALTFAGLLLHLDWAEEGGPLRLAASLALYLASLLMYEALAFFPLALAAALAARALAEGRPRREALVLAWKVLWPFGPVLAGGLLWQRIGSAVLLATPDTKAAGLSPAHMLKVAGAAFECVSNRVLHITWLSLDASRLVLTPLTWATCAVFAAVGALLLTEAVHGGDRASRADVAAAAAFGLAAWVAAYAPYAFTRDYTPQVFGVMSRTNAGGAFATGMLFAALALAPRGRRASALLAAILLAFTMTDWYRAVQWTRSWDVQRQIMSEMASAGPSLPQGATVLLARAPTDIDGAIVFDASWDFDGALRVATGRPDLKGDIYGRSPHQEPLLFVFDHRTRTLYRARDKPSLPTGRGPI